MLLLIYLILLNISELFALLLLFLPCITEEERLIIHFNPTSEAYLYISQPLESLVCALVPEEQRKAALVGKLYMSPHLNRIMGQ